MKELLKISDLKLNYGMISAVKGIDLSVGEGQIVAILGANGAGKTSTLKVISGLLKPSSGEIIFDGVNIAGKPAHKVAKQGIMQSPEGRFVLVGLTVEENLRVGGYNIKSKEELARNFERVYTLFPRLKERAKQQSSTLSGGEQQMLAIGRALMGSPKLLILDEPSLGLAPLLIKDIFKTLVKIKEEGTTILIVEQNALATLKIADYAYVLELGKISMHGKAEDLLRDERLISAYLGG
ncbi:MAG: ABC transporter ATP-binding protein [Clostridia bacterium]|nr:ABC transporter ATP-binding protein [Clostridia bacterium]MBR3875930.1 ABC transporter ATP-binding protein [Clostridia bacterium]